MSDVEKKGCEPEDKCCKCMPIVCGMKALSYLNLIGVVTNTALAITLCTQDSDAGLIYFFCLIPVFVASIFFARFLLLDAKRGRLHLTTAIWLSCAYNILIATVHLVAANTTGEFNLDLEKVAYASQGQFDGKKVFAR